MLKIDFFPPDMVKEYEVQISKEIKKRNGNKNEIRFIPHMPKYTISIHDLLTADRSKIFNTNGIKLYMCICSSQKYISQSNVELLCTLKSDFPQVHEIEHRNNNYQYRIYSTTYCTTCKDDTSPNDIITLVANIIKYKLALFDRNFAINYFNNAYIIRSISDLNSVLKQMFNEVNKELQDCTNNKKRFIDYSILSSKSDLRHKLMNSVGLRTCPYCNRNYITSYGEKSTADLDHFYQKKQYPLFALSLFNFVPSCSVCNSRMKNTYPADNALYPYEEGFEDDAKFELKTTRKPYEKNFCESIFHLFQAIRDTKFDEFSLEIITDPKTPPSKKEKIENSEKLFHLTEVYENHKQDALEAALRTRVYCEGNYKIHCQRLLKKLEQAGMKMSSSVDLEASVFADMIDYEWMMFGIFFNDEKRRYEKPLSKMIYDIYKSGKE